MNVRGIEVWNDPTNMYEDDGLYASADIGKKGETPQGFCVYDFAGTAQTNTAVTGLEVRIKSSAERADRIATHVLQLATNVNDLAGTKSPTSHHDQHGDNLWGTTFGYWHGGGDSTDTWGFGALTVANVVEGNFGVNFACENFPQKNTLWARVDCIELKVYWNGGDSGWLQPRNELGNNA